LNESTKIERNQSRGGIARIWRLAKKELRETLRDRRTIVTLVLMPLLVYPILSLVFQNFLMSSLGAAADGEEQKHTIVFASNLPEAESAAFLEGASKFISKFELESIEDSTVEQSDDVLSEDMEPLDYRVVVAENEFGTELVNNNWLFLSDSSEAGLTQIVAQGDADVGLILDIDAENFRVTGLKIIQREDQVSSVASRYLRNRFRQWNDIFVEKALVARGGELPVAEPIVKRIEIGAGSSAGGTIASMIPLALVLMTITGAVYPAIDLTAGERERGTLETLMAAPVPRMGILFAKFIAVVTVAVLTAILNLIGMTIVMWVFQLDQMLPGGGLSVGVIFKVFLLLVLFAAFFAACLLMVTSFARSFKEAQAYLVPIILLSLGPGLLAMSPSVELTGLTAVTPMMNLLVLARDVMQGQVQTGAAVIAVISTLVYAFVALTIAARTFGADTILYSQQLSLSSLVTRPKRVASYVPIVSALLCLVLLLPMNMVSIGILGRLGKALADNFSMFCLLMGSFTVLSFFVIPSIVAWMNRVNFRSAFGLKGSSPLFFIGALILGLSLWPIVMLMVEGTYAIYGMVAGETAASARHEMLVKLSEEQVVRFRQVSPPIIALCFSLIPAFCEEWFFRGMLLRALSREWKAWNAILTTAILFGVFHILSNSAISLDRFLPTMLIGILLGYLAWKSNSIWPGVILHALHNGTVAFLGYYQPQLAELSWFPQEAEKIPPTWGLIACVVATVGLAIVIKTSRRIEPSDA
jgi:membrane protease YdiL (CAAX protease family)/ABC-type transport system involved in multi-copper enzyme maturation permease subunit